MSVARYIGTLVPLKLVGSLFGKRHLRTGRICAAKGCQCGDSGGTVPAGSTVRILAQRGRHLYANWLKGGVIGCDAAMDAYVVGDWDRGPVLGRFAITSESMASSGRLSWDRPVSWTIVSTPDESMNFSRSRASEKADGAQWHSPAHPDLAPGLDHGCLSGRRNGHLL